MFFSSIRRYALLLITFMVMSSFAVAQDYRGKVQGLVTDESGAVIPGAKVVLTNNQTNVGVTIQTNDEGRYLFNYVEPGNYSVTAEKDGFKKTIQQKLVVQIQGNLTADLKLSVVTPLRRSPLKILRHQFNSIRVAQI